MRLSKGLLVTGGIASALVAAFVFGLLLPGQRKLRERRQSIEQLQTSLTMEQEEVKQLSAVYAEVEQLSGRMSEFEKLVPCNHEFAETYRVLSELIESTGLHRNLIQPERVRPLARSEAINIPRGSSVMVQPVSLEMEGGIESIAKFLAALEGWSRLSRIDRIVIHPIGGASANYGLTGNQRLHCTLFLNTFYLPRGELQNDAVSIGATGPGLARR